MFMNDLDIRKVLKSELLDKHGNDSETMILEELGLKHGRTRIDLVVINDRLHGYEIKSDRDSLKRLTEQINIYSSIMDRVTLVVGYRHAYSALKMVPEWWGVRLAEKDEESGAVFLSDARLPTDNPRVDINAIASLLWRDEALDILEEIGESKGVHSKTRTDIYNRLVQVIEPRHLCAMVRRQLKSRKDWRSGAQRRSCGG